MNKQLLQEVARLQEIMGIPNRTNQLLTEGQLIKEQLIKNVLGGAKALTALEKLNAEAVFQIIKGFKRIDFTKVAKLNLGPESVNLLKMFDAELASASRYAGTPPNWKLTMGDDLITQFKRPEDLLDDIFTVGVQGDVLRGINRMRAAVDPFAFAVSLSKMDDFWVLLKSRLVSAKKPFGDKNTLAGLTDLSKDSRAIDDIYDELRLMDGVDDYIDDIAKVIAKSDDVVVRGAISASKAKVKSSIGKSFKDWIGKYFWYLVGGTLLTDTLFQWAPFFEIPDPSEGDATNKAFHVNYWRDQWKAEGNDSKEYKKQYLFDSNTDYPSGTLLAIAEWLDEVLVVSPMTEVPEVEIASLYGGPQYPNVVPANIRKTGGIINSLEKASQVSWAYSKISSGSGGLKEQMIKIMKVRVGGLIGRSSAYYGGDVGAEAVFEKINALSLAANTDPKTKETTYEYHEEDLNKDMKQAMPYWEGKRTYPAGGDVWCLNYPAVGKVPPAVMQCVFRWMQENKYNPGETFDTANSDIPPSRFNDCFSDVYSKNPNYLYPAYSKNMSGIKTCDEPPKGKLDDFEAQVKDYSDAAYNKIKENEENGK